MPKKKSTPNRQEMLAKLKGLEEPHILVVDDPEGESPEEFAYLLTTAGVQGPLELVGEDKEEMDDELCDALFEQLSALEGIATWDEMADEELELWSEAVDEYTGAEEVD